MAFTLHLSNHIEELCSRCLSILAQPMLDPLATEFVLVDNKVMGQWLGLQLAQKEGIAANIRYIQPHELFWLLARALVSAEIPHETPLSKQEMLWKLYGVFSDSEFLAQQVMQPVKHYFQGEGNVVLKRYQLAVAVSDLFDQYLVYRPEMMLEWESKSQIYSEDGNAQWQHALWTKLSNSSVSNFDKKLHHRAAIERKLLESLHESNSDTISKKTQLQRLSVFGISSMPPQLQEMLFLLGGHIPVDLFVLNPCRHYWFDIQSEKVLSRKLEKKKLEGGVIGNPLLASQGQQVRDFIGGLYAKFDQYSFQDVDYYIDNKTDLLLGCIQQEILDLQYQGGLADLSSVKTGMHKQVVPAFDLQQKVRSVQVHSCHSPLREVEVLYDQLMAMFAQDDTLKPRDVVVMMPQVASYVPYIETVFGVTSREFPYFVMDRTWLEEVPLLHALDFLLSLPSSRFPLTDILALLEVEAVQERFSLNRDGFEKLKTWLRDAGARWGVDAAHREQEKLPSYSEFSWEFAINRLLAGYSMSSDDACPVSMAKESLPVLPYDEVEGGEAWLLNSFLLCWQKLKQYRHALAEPARPEVWAERITNLLDDFFVAKTDDEQLALREIRRQVSSLRKVHMWCTEQIDLSVVKAMLQPTLQAPAQGRHPWREGIKFCSLMPMRGVPFNVVYMLGMNQSDYPKRHTPISFDLMRNNYRAGDRSRRVDDRWLFLEALLSARKAFHVSYIGRDQRKNEARQPSVVVAELLDYLRHGYCLSDEKNCDDKALLKELVLEHPLQPFSQDYFLMDKNSRLQSYNDQAFAIALHKKNNKGEAYDNAVWIESTKSDQALDVSLEGFLCFFAEPDRWFFNYRHKNISLKIHDESVSSTEIFDLSDGLDEWKLKEALRQQAYIIPPVSGDDDQRKQVVFDAVQRQWEAKACWPLGAGGDNLRNKILENMSVDWLDAKYKVMGDPISYSGRQTFHTALGSLTISGELACLGDTLFVHTASKRSNKYQFKLAIQAAFAGLTMPSVKRVVASYWGGDEATFQGDLDKKDNACFLQKLVELYMQYRDGGLPFSPNDSLKYTPELSKKENREKWDRIIEEAWHGGQAVGGIADDIQKRTYFVAKQRLEGEQFLSVAKEIHMAYTRWQEGEEKISEVEVGAADQIQGAKP